MIILEYNDKMAIILCDNYIESNLLKSKIREKITKSSKTYNYEITVDHTAYYESDRHYGKFLSIYMKHLRKYKIRESSHNNGAPPIVRIKTEKVNIEYCHWDLGSFRIEKPNKYKILYKSSGDVQVTYYPDGVRYINVIYTPEKEAIRWKPCKEVGPRVYSPNYDKETCDKYLLKYMQKHEKYKREASMPTYIFLIYLLHKYCGYVE